MSWAKRRADRIRAEVQMLDVLVDYGYPVSPHGDDREQQFPCDLHGDGQDNTPSARLYPASNSIFCFAENRYRDIIQLVREKEGLDFWGAIKKIEARYKLPALPWEDDGEDKVISLDERVQTALHSERSYTEEHERIRTFLQNLTSEREVPMTRVLGYWETFDRITHGVKVEEWGESKGKHHLLQLFERIRSEVMP